MFILRLKPRIAKTSQRGILIATYPIGISCAARLLSRLGCFSECGGPQLTSAPSSRFPECLPCKSLYSFGALLYGVHGSTPGAFDFPVGNREFAEQFVTVGTPDFLHLYLPLSLFLLLPLFPTLGLLLRNGNHPSAAFTACQSWLHSSSSSNNAGNSRHIPFA